MSGERQTETHQAEEPGGASSGFADAEIERWLREEVPMTDWLRKRFEREFPVPTRTREASDGD